MSTSTSYSEGEVCQCRIGRYWVGCFPCARKSPGRKATTLEEMAAHDECLDADKTKVVVRKSFPQAQLPIYIWHSGCKPRYRDEDGKFYTQEISLRPPSTVCRSTVVRVHNTLIPRKSSKVSGSHPSTVTC